LEKAKEDIHGLKTFEELKAFKESQGKELIEVFNFVQFSKRFENNTYTRKQLLNAIDSSIFGIQKKKSLQLQRKRQQAAIAKGDIVRGVERMPENKRKELRRFNALYKIAQVAFSQPEDFFEIPSRRYKKERYPGDKRTNTYNRKLEIDSIDDVVIHHVPE
jgi:hypothetical protein